MSEPRRGWVVTEISTITEPFLTIDPRQTPDQIFQYIDIGSIDNQSHTITEPKNFRGQDAPSRARRVVNSGDILFSTVRTYLKNVAMVPANLDGELASTGIAIMRPSAAVDPRFLFAWTRSDQFVQEISRSQDGTMYPAVSDHDVGCAQIPVPPLPEQQRIVAKIDSLSAKSRRAREHLDHIPRLVEKYKQAILAAAFRGDLTREWRVEKQSGQNADEFIAESRNRYEKLRLASALGRDERTAQLSLDDDLRREIEQREHQVPLPTGWRWSSLGLVFGVYVGATPSRKNPDYWGGGIPWVSSGEVAFCRVSRTHQTISPLGLEHTSTRLHPPGTLLIGMIGEGKTRGQVAILDIAACNNQNCAAIRVSEAGYSPYYVYYYLESSYHHTRAVGSGNNQQALNKDLVQRLLFPLAPQDEAAEIVATISRAFSHIDRLAAETTSARKLVDRLDQAVLAKAFRGDLVPQDPNDEPASVLLERIRVERAARPSRPKRGRKPRAAAE